MKINKSHFSGKYYQKFKQVGKIKQLLFKKLIDSRQPILHVIKHRFNSNSKLLDFGCGTGLFGHHANKHFEYLGVDFSVDAIKTAKRNHKSVKFTVGSLPYLKKISSEKYDVIVCFDVLEHIKNLDNYLEEFWRIMKKDGWLIASSPIADSIGLKKLEQRWLGFEDPSHIRIVSRNEWDRIFFRSGFIRIKTYSSGIISSPSEDWKIVGWLKLAHFITQPMGLLGFPLPSWATDEDYSICIKNPHFRN